MMKQKLDFIKLMLLGIGFILFSFCFSQIGTPLMIVFGSIGMLFMIGGFFTNDDDDGDTKH